MNITTVLFDLDGTLLPMDQDKFTECYFKLLAVKAAPYGYEPKKLVSAIWQGTAAMVKNDGTKTNEDAFWDEFAAIYGKDKLCDRVLFDEFYANEFQNAAFSCGFNPKSKASVDEIKSMGYRTILATNPIFPKTATESRVRWAGLDPTDFEFCTTYENSIHSKPNPLYYADILEKTGLTPQECLMVGNDVSEDMIAQTLGINVFLLTDCLINKDNCDIAQYPNGSFDELVRYLTI